MESPQTSKVALTSSSRLRERGDGGDGGGDDDEGGGDGGGAMSAREGEPEVWCQ